MITGIYETHIEVGNLEKAILFYTETLGLRLGHLDDARRIAFLWVGKQKDYMLGLWEKADPQARHFAFRCTVDFISQQSSNFLSGQGLQPYNFLKDGTSQPMVFAWMPALAIYFNDADGNQLEFIAPLEGEADAEAGVMSYAAWLARRTGL